jgi:hypothetical protein
VKKPAPPKKPRPFFAVGNAVDATIAIGNVAHGTLAIGFSLSVGVVSIGINAVGSFAAFGVNAAAPIAVAAVNAVGVFAIAGVNGFASVGTAWVNRASHPLIGLVVSTIFFIVALSHYNATKERAEPRPILADPLPFDVACERGGWVRAEHVELHGDRATLRAGREAAIEAQIGPGLEERLRALAQGAAYIELQIETRPVADEGGYREASFERVAVVVDAVAAPQSKPLLIAFGEWLARSKSTHVVFAGIGVVAAVVTTLIGAIW